MKQASSEIEKGTAVGHHRVAARNRARVAGTVRYVTLIVLGVAFATPLLWMLSTALKSDEQVVRFPPVLWPNPALWSNFIDAWGFAPFNTYLRNSIVITVISTIGQTASACLVGYAFARLRFPFREQLFILVLATMMVPQIVLLIPQFTLFRRLGWIDTFLPLTVPFFFGGSPFFIFLLRQYFRSIPMELGEAAKLDGASEWQVFSRIVLPLALPAVSTVTIFAALASWNDFLGPLIYLTSDENKTLMLGLQSFIGENSQQFQYMMAASTLVALPTIVLYFAFQRWFMRSVVLTGMRA